MGVLQRYRHLKSKHDQLDKEVDETVQQDWTDRVALRRLKSRRLLVHNELAALERLLAAIGRKPSSPLSA